MLCRVQLSDSTRKRRLPPRRCAISAIQPPRAPTILIWFHYWQDIDAGHSRIPTFCTTEPRTALSKNVGDSVGSQAPIGVCFDNEFSNSDTFAFRRALTAYDNP